MKTKRRRQQGSSALLLIDVINDLDFPQGRRLLRYALPAARRIGRLKKRAAASDIPAIYVNDNFGKWRSDFRQQVAHCLHHGTLGKQIAQLLRPDEEDYFVLKPRHSGFYSTSLEVLLGQLGVETLILTGFSTEICVIYTANDAYMRNFRIIIPRDCVAAETPEGNRRALAQMKRYLKADIRSSQAIRF